MESYKRIILYSLSNVMKRISKRLASNSIGIGALCS
jgi:hypothetical protein